MPALNILDAVLESVRASANLEKLASLVSKSEDKKEITALKIAVDNEVFELAKTANAELLKKLLTGAAYGTGAAVPAVAGGAYLLHRGSEEAEKATSDVRNKVLQSALGLAGIGAGAYGLQRAFAQPEKQASVRDTRRDTQAKEELVEKLATVSVIDDELTSVSAFGMSKEAKELAMSLITTNRAYGVRLLQEAMEA